MLSRNPTFSRKNSGGGAGNRSRVRNGTGAPRSSTLGSRNRSARWSPQTAEAVHCVDGTAGWRVDSQA